MAYPASFIAYQFVKKAIENKVAITPMKVQKMVYFAHGYHLAKYHGEPLISERFEAWKFGPVVPSLYRDFRYFGNNRITESYLETAPTFYFDLLSLDEKAVDAIEYTWKATKGISATKLSNWTHLPNSPWSETYDPEELSTPIDDGLIRKYFSDLILNNA